MTAPTPISVEVFDSQLRTNFVGQFAPRRLSHVKTRADFAEVTVETLGGKVLSTSDDFFASKDNLIKPYVSHPFS